MSVNLQAQQLATQLIEQGSMSQSEASKSVKLTATEPQKRLNCTSIKHASCTSTNPCLTCTHAVQDSKRIKSTESKNPQKESHTPNHPNTDETEVTTPWYLLAWDPLKEFEEHELPMIWWTNTHWMMIPMMIKTKKRKMNGSMLK